METIGSGIENTVVYPSGTRIDLEQAEQYFDIEAENYDIESINLPRPDQSSIDQAANAVETLMEETNVDEEEIFGLFVSTDYEDICEASELQNNLNKQGLNIQPNTDGNSLSEIRLLQEACSQHYARAGESEYSIAVTSAQSRPEGGVPNGSAAIAYLIGNNPDLELSKKGGLSGVVEDPYLNGNSSLTDDEFTTALNNLREASEGFIQQATSFKFPYGSDVVGNNPDLVHPDNISYCYFSIPEKDKQLEAVARGAGKLARVSRDELLDFEKDPEKRDEVEYFENLIADGFFQEFRERAHEPVLGLQRSIGVLSPGSLGLQRASALIDYASELGEHEGDGLMMVGELRSGGRGAEVHAEKIVGVPDVHVEDSHVEDVGLDELEDVLGE